MSIIQAAQLMDEIDRLKEKLATADHARQVAERERDALRAKLDDLDLVKDGVCLVCGLDSIELATERDAWQQRWWQENENLERVSAEYTARLQAAYHACQAAEACWHNEQVISQREFDARQAVERKLAAEVDASEQYVRLIGERDMKIDTLAAEVARLQRQVAGHMDTMEGAGEERRGLIAKLRTAKAEVARLRGALERTIAAVETFPKLRPPVKPIVVHYGPSNHEQGAECYVCDALQPGGEDSRNV